MNNNDVIISPLADKVIDFLLGIAIALLIILLGKFFTRIVVALVDKFCIKSSKINPSAHNFIVACTKAFCGVLIVISAISCVFNITSLLAALGAAGLTASFALQGSLANFVSGAQLVFSRPFEIGNFIQIEEYMGTVLKTNVLTTTLLTPDNKQVIIPNSHITSTTLINYSAEETRRVDLIYSVSYSTDLNKALETVLKVAENCEYVLKSPEPFVGVHAHSDSSIDLMLKVWINNTNYWNCYYYLQKGIKEAFDEAEIEIPFPQLDVHTK